MSTYPVFKKAEKTVFTIDLIKNKIPIASEAEKLFYIFLLLEKKLNVKRNKQFYINSYLFRPDILYITKRLILDIEIDEPYTLLNSKPTHFIGSDDNRDRILNQNGITVLRFAEYQVQYHKETCYKIIMNVIGGKHYLENISHEPTFLIDRWTKSKAQEFIKENKRELFEYSTLEIIESAPKILQNFENFNSLVEYIKEYHIRDFDKTKEIIYLPFNISNVKIHEQYGDRMIFCDLSTTYREVDGVELLYNSPPPRYKVYEKNDNRLYDILINLKSNAEKVALNESKYLNNYFYNIFFWGNPKEYRTSTLNYRLII